MLSIQLYIDMKTHLIDNLSHPTESHYHHVEPQPLLKFNNLHQLMIMIIQLLTVVNIAIEVHDLKSLANSLR